MLSGIAVIAPDDEAGARDRGLAVLAFGTRAVLGPDATAMRFDDLLGDREAEARVLAKALMRPVGVETLEHALQRIGPDAGAVIIDNDLDVVAQAAAKDAHLAAGLRERLRVGRQV